MGLNKIFSFFIAKLYEKISSALIGKFSKN